MKSNKAIIVALIVCFLTSLSAQDLSRFADKQAYRLSGGLRLGLQSYTDFVPNNVDRFRPLGYALSGTLNIHLGAVTVPLNLNLNDTQRSLSSPFNLYGASPYYKWAKIHLGHRSLNFSPYTYSGKSFYGYGIELTPGIWSVKAFNGKLRSLSTISRDIDGIVVLPTYDRNIQGVQIGVGKRNRRFEISGVRIKDNPESVPNPLVQPIENIVIGSALKWRFFKKLSLNIQTAASLFTANLNAGNFEILDPAFRQLNDLATINISSRWNWAGDASIDYSANGYNIGLKYRRIQPYFQSLGINFLQNDIQNITINFGFSLLKRKLNIKASAGLQTDNLQNNKAFTSNRTIGALTAVFRPAKNFNMMLRYSNYQHESTTGLLAINDTFRIFTTTHNSMFSTQFTLLENDAKNIKTQWNIFNNQIIDQTDEFNASGSFNGFGVNGKITLGVKNINLSVGPSLNFNRYKSKYNTTGRLGAGIFLSKSFFDKKINLSTTFLYNQNQLDGKSNGQLISGRVHARGALSKAHSLTMTINFNDQAPLAGRVYRDMRTVLAYNLKF